jgi:gamma-glutamylcyclotransferase (GGCT)/AIG2-like uncharacterized protein YtfP
MATDRPQPMEPSCDLLFVYGTLKRGLANHHQLGGACFVADARMEGVDLHDLGPFPMAIAGEGFADGELYRVDGEQLARLDRFEGVPRLYTRHRMPLRDGRTAWIYLGRPRQVRHSPRLAEGRWPATDGCRSRQGGPQGLLPVVLLFAALLSVQGLRAEPSLALCRRWQRSDGSDAIQLGNAIGAAAYLTKVQAFAESDPDHPRLLYAPGDLKRACGAWR